MGPPARLPRPPRAETARSETSEPRFEHKPETSAPRSEPPPRADSPPHEEPRHEQADPPPNEKRGPSVELVPLMYGELAVRTVSRGGDKWVVAEDVRHADGLDIVTVSHGVSRLDPDGTEVIVQPDTAGRKQERLIV